MIKERKWYKDFVSACQKGRVSPHGYKDFREEIPQEVFSEVFKEMSYKQLICLKGIAHLLSKVG